MQAPDPTLLAAQTRKEAQPALSAGVQAPDPTLLAAVSTSGRPGGFLDGRRRAPLCWVAKRPL